MITNPSWFNEGYIKEKNQFMADPLFPSDREAEPT